MRQRLTISRTLRAGLAGAVTAALVLPAGAAEASPLAHAGAATLPDYALTDIPKSANRFDVKPSARHPRPVIVVHGTWVSASRPYRLLDRLAGEGFSVFAFNYGRDTRSIAGRDLGAFGTASIAESAIELARFVDVVRARTGAREVDLVGLSQGGLLARRYLFDHVSRGNHVPVARVITLGAPNHGTTLHGISELAGEEGVFAGPLSALRRDARGILGASALDQLRGSAFLAETNSLGDTVPGVEYTVVATRYDVVVTPSESTFLRQGPGADVHNIFVQDRYPSNVVDHLSFAGNPDVQAIVLEALGRPHDAAVDEAGSPA